MSNPHKKKLNSSQVEMKNTHLEETMVLDDYHSDDSQEEQLTARRVIALSSLPSKADLNSYKCNENLNKYLNYKQELKRIKQNQHLVSYIFTQIHLIVFF